MTWDLRDRKKLQAPSSLATLQAKPILPKVPGKRGRPKGSANKKTRIFAGRSSNSVTAAKRRITQAQLAIKAAQKSLKEAMRMLEQGGGA